MQIPKDTKTEIKKVQACTHTHFDLTQNVFDAHQVSGVIMRIMFVIIMSAMICLYMFLFQSVYLMSSESVQKKKLKNSEKKKAVFVKVFFWMKQSNNHEI